MRGMAVCAYEWGRFYIDCEAMYAVRFEMQTVSGVDGTWKQEAQSAPLPRSFQELTFRHAFRNEVRRAAHGTRDAAAHVALSPVGELLLFDTGTAGFQKFEAEHL